MTNRNYRANRAKVRAVQETYLLSDAKRFGHHGVKDFIEVVRQRHNMPITEAYARDLLARAGQPMKE